MELHSLTPSDYTAALPLLPEEPPTLAARAALLTVRAGVTVHADDATTPTCVAVEWQTATGDVVTLAGNADHPALHTYLRALRGPVTLHVPDAFTARLLTLLPGLVPRPMLTATLPPGADAAFRALPPGGVRRLRPNDARHLAPFPAWLWEAYGSPDAALRDGVIYARYLRAEIIALAALAAHTEHTDALTAYTIERARRNGFARECATRLIAAVVAERGTRPMWTCAADDAPALALAHCLGLTETQGWTLYELG